MQVYINTDERDLKRSWERLSKLRFKRAVTGNHRGPEIGVGEIGGETIDETGKYYMEIKMRTGSTARSRSNSSQQVSDTLIVRW